MINQKNIVKLSIAMIAIMGVVGCSKNNPSSTNTTPPVRPKIGSMFTYDMYNKTTSHTIDTSSRARVTYTLIDTSATAAPLTNIYRYAGSDSSEMDVHYEANGDVSTFVGFAVQGQTVFTEWITLPVSSHTTQNPPSLTITSPAPGTVMTSVVYNGSDTTRVGTTSLSTIKTTANYMGVFQTPAPDTVTASSQYQYDPQSEMIAKSDLSVYGTLGTLDLNGGTYMVLRSSTIIK